MKCLNKTYLILIVLFSFNSVFLVAQNRTELEKKKYKIQQEIIYANQLLNNNRKEKEKTLEGINIMSKKIELRNNLINNLENEVLLLEEKEKEYGKIITELQKEEVDLKNNYTQIILKYSMRRNNNFFWMYFFASDNIQILYNRLIYYKRLTNEIKNKALIIENVRTEIINSQSELNKIKLQKKININQKEVENNNMKQEIQERNKKVLELCQKEKDIKKKIDEQKRIAEKLESEIRRVIEEENKKVNKNGKLSLTPEERLIAGDFLKNKGRLPWPVEKGIITSDFGEHPHAVLKNIKVRNNGIDIATENGSKVNVLFDGTVTKVVAILGANYTVIVRHGNFLSVYQNLTKVYVKTGDNVKTKQVIGEISGTENENGNLLHLEIWKDYERLNPKEWLAN